MLHLHQRMHKAKASNSDLDFEFQQMSLSDPLSLSRNHPIHLENPDILHYKICQYTMATSSIR